MRKYRFFLVAPEIPRFCRVFEHKFLMLFYSQLLNGEIILSNLIAISRRLIDQISTLKQSDQIILKCVYASNSNSMTFNKVLSIVTAAKMESLAILLEPYKHLIIGAASAVTYLHQLSGAVVCNTIRKEKSTSKRSLVPFLAGVVM